jgi:putative flippase GtrA
MLDFVKTLLEIKAVRYLVSAVTATLVDVGMYFIAFNYLFRKIDIPIIGSFVLTAPTSSLMLSYSCGLVTNFLITRHFVFTESDLKAHHQFLRYVMVAFVVLILNYFLMRILIRQFEWYPTLARAFSAVSIGVFSFFTHKAFSFKVSETEEEDVIN